MDCVIASAAGTDLGLIAIADIVADHNPESAASASHRAAQAFDHFPGCSTFLAADLSGGYLAFLRDGHCTLIRPAPGCSHVPAAVAEASAVLLYAWACTGSVPCTVAVSLTPARAA